MAKSHPVAVVTGGGQGIGKGICQKLVADGYRVIVADADGEAAEETARELSEEGQARGVVADVSQEDSVIRLFDLVTKHWGRLDALVNNAGISSPESGPIEELTLEHWNKVIGTNLTGMFLCAKYGTPLMRLHRGAAIVNIASTRALQSEPHTEAYAASKGGIVALTHALAISLGPDIRVNCISPGWIVVDDWKKSSQSHAPELRPADHAQHPVGRAGKPPDIAELAAFLLSAKAGFITGQNFVVDGGMTKKMVYME